MSALRLTLRQPPAQAVDLSPMVPDRLAGLSPAEVAATPLQCGNRTVRADSLFTIAGTPGDLLEIHGATDRLERIGAGMSRGRVVVQGDAGAYCGLGMGGGELEVSGSAGAFAASGMLGGKLRISGDAGDFLAAALPGNHQGMRGGVVVVGGNAGARAGDRMRRGVVLIEGDAGDYCASRMVAGTLGVWGKVGSFPGLAMRRGTLLLQAPAELLPTFNDCGEYPLTVLTLMVRSWRGLPGRFGTLPDTGLRVRRFLGDLANDGRGEILLRA